jgi:predicted nucleic acid-binding protein
MLVLDASVVVPLLLPVPGQPTLSVNLAENQIHAPQLLAIEVAHALWKYARTGLLSTVDTKRAWSKFETLPFHFAEDRDLAPQALGLAEALAHPVYDCLYLALALARGTRVVTRDKRFAAATRASYATQVELID